jgi:hypothetical protein
MHERLRVQLGLHWNENEALVERRKREVGKIRFGLREAADRVRLAVQWDDSVRAELAALAAPYQDDPGELLACVAAEMARLESVAGQTAQRLVYAQQHEQKWQEKLAEAEGLVEIARTESSRLHEEIVRLNSKILEMAARNN